MTTSRPPMNFQFASPTTGYLLLRDSIPLLSFIGVGALLQATLFPQGKYALVLPLLLILSPWVGSVLMWMGVRENGWTEGVRDGRWFAKLGEGEAETEGEGREMALLMIGARSNGPFGIFDWRGIKIAKQFGQMMKDLAEDPASGLIGYAPSRSPPLPAFFTEAPKLHGIYSGETYLSTGRFWRNRLTTFLYFRSTEDVTRFAAEKLHRFAQQEYKSSKNNKEYELWHELFSVKAGQHDCVYVNATAHGMGALHELNSDGKWESITKKIDSKHNTSKARMGLQ